MKLKKHSLLILFFLLLIVAVLGKADSSNLTPTSSQSSPHNRTIKQEPIFSPLQSGIGNVNATIVVYPSFYQVRLSLQYIGGDEPLLQDTLLFPKEFELIEAKPIDSDLAVNAMINKFDNQSIVSLNFSRVLLPSEVLNILVIGNVELDISQSFIKLMIWWNYSRPVGVEDTNILIFPGIDYAGSSPQPSRIRPNLNGFLELWWIDIFSSGFSTNLSLVITPTARNEVLTYPLSIDLNISSRQVFVNFLIANVGKTAANITIVAPESVHTSQSRVILEAFEQKEIILTLTKNQANRIRGTIEIYTNRTETPLEIPVRVRFQNTPSSTNTLTLFLAALLAALFGALFGGFLYYYLNRKEDSSILTSSTLRTNPTNAEIPDEQSVLHALDEAKARIGERRASILEYIYRNPGCSQQEIAENFGFSKATISREIQKLEAQGYIRKKRSGMSHQLFLTHKIMNKKQNF